MSKNYLIKLRPLEPFFFGGEYTFGEDESSRYFAKSEPFPQQSALLGMFRKAILNKKNIMTLHKKGEWVDSRKKEFQSTNKNYKEAKRLIGKGRFNYESKFDLGEVIQSISPIFILKDSENYFVDAKDREFTPTQSSNKMLIDDEVQNIIIFDGYDAKNPPSIKFCSKTKSIEFDDIFKSIKTVGIKKEQKDEAFFQKESYSFKNKEEFAFIVRSSEDMCFLDKTLVALGADQSSFMLQVSDDIDSFEKLTDGVFVSKDEFDRVILLSETLLNDDAYKLCDFIIGSRKSMRHLTQNENKTQKKKSKSKRYFLFDRGTVIYTSKPSELEKKLNIAHLQTVGINKYKTVKKGESNA